MSRKNTYERSDAAIAQGYQDTADQARRDAADAQAAGRDPRRAQAAADLYDQIAADLRNR